MEHQNTNFGPPRPNYSSAGELFVQEDYGGYNCQYRHRGGRFSGSYSGPHYPQGGWRWGHGQQSADNYHKKFSHRCPNEMVGGHHRQFQSPPQYSSTPRKPFHHNRSRGNFHQQRNQGLRFHGTVQSGGDGTENIENWISARMWEDPWTHLLPSAAIHNPKLSEQDAIGKMLHSDLNTSDITKYYSALDTSILNTASNSASNKASELDDPVAIGVEDVISKPAIKISEALESDSEICDEQNQNHSFLNT